MKTAEEFISQYPLTERLFKVILTNDTDSLIHQAMIEFAKEAIKADRINLLEHVLLSIDGITEKSNGQQYLVDRGNHYSETEIRIDKNSIINAPNIHLL